MVPALLTGCPSPWGHQGALGKCESYGCTRFVAPGIKTLCAWASSNHPTCFQGLLSALACEQQLCPSSFPSKFMTTGLCTCSNFRLRTPDRGMACFLSSFSFVLRSRLHMETVLVHPIIHSLPNLLSSPPCLWPILPLIVYSFVNSFKWSPDGWESRSCFVH